MADQPETLLICCGAVARSIVTLLRQNGWDHMHIQCLPASVHNHPETIPEAVRAKIRAGRERFDDILVLFSDCGTGGELDKVLREEGVDRIGGTHCYEVFAGTDSFARLMDEELGTFFLTDFLARHFERLVVTGLGMDRRPELRDLYFAHYTRLVYLAQTEDADLTARAERAAETLGLEFEKRFVGLGGYERFLAARQVDLD
jgi:hypothetical protein